MELREQGGLDPCPGLVPGPKLVPEGFNHMIGGYADVRPPGLDQLQDGMQDAGYGAIRPVGAFGEAAQTIEVPEQLIGPVEEMNDHEAGRLSGFAEVAEGNGIAESIHRGYAVLPLGSRGAAQQIGRPRLCHQGHPLPSGAGLAAKAESATGEKGDSDNVAENRFIPVPTDAGARAVFRHQHLLKLGGGQPGKCASPIPKRVQERRNVLGLLKRPLIEVVPPAEGNGAPLSDKALELELLERQLSHLLE